VAVLMGYFRGGEAVGGPRTINGDSVRVDQRGGDYPDKRLKIAPRLLRLMKRINPENLRCLPRREDVQLMARPCDT